MAETNVFDELLWKICLELIKFRPLHHRTEFSCCCLLIKRLTNVMRNSYHIWMSSPSVFPLWKFCRYSCLALQIVSMEEWCYSAIKEHISKIFTIFIVQNGFPLKWFLDILIICMQICLTTDVAQTEKKQIHFCFPWYFQNGLIFLLRKK